MSTERTGGPSPIGPRGLPNNSKVDREAAQKVEKVREIDADEETQRRKRKFQMMMGDEDQLADVDKGPRVPSPFETQFYATAEPTAEKPSFPDLEDAVVPSPAYSPPPDVTSMPYPQDEEIPGDLPRSDSFWEGMDVPPDQPLKPPQFNETPGSAARTDQSAEQTQGPREASKKGESAAPAKSPKKEPSPFGAPGKPVEKGAKSKEEEPPFFAQSPQKKEEPSSLRGKKVGSPFGDLPEEEMPAFPPIDKKEKRAAELRGAPESGKEPLGEDGRDVPSTRYVPREEIPLQQRREEKERIRTGEKIHWDKDKTDEKNSTPFSDKEKDPTALPYQEREAQRRERQKVEKPFEVTAASLPSFPMEIQPMAQSATALATPYLSPATIPLFFQMVGTLFIMSAPPGISRTEILLNNPTFADSKFFGSKIIIEKYATAPDSFNIRLTGSDEAVVAFRENIPSLMTAFQTGNFKFRVSRIDAEYSVEKPHFHRKGKGEGKDLGGGLGNRK